MEFEVKQNLHDCDSRGFWYIGRRVDEKDDWGLDEYIWNDLTVKSFCGDDGYYATKAEAERYLMAYRVKGMEFTIYHVNGSTNWWYIVANEKYKHLKYVWRDLELHPCVMYDIGWKGYYKSKAEAETILAQFKEKYSVPQTTEIKDIKFIVRQCRHWPERGWYIVTDTGAGHGKERFVWKDLELHEGTGYGAINYNECGAPGYYSTEIYAKAVLHKFKEKHNMAKDTIKINVEINGVVKPLCDLSEETLLKIRKASKPKPVPVFQVCHTKYPDPRLIVKFPEDAGRHAGKFVMFHSDGSVFDSNDTMYPFSHYDGLHELRLDEV